MNPEQPDKPDAGAEPPTSVTPSLDLLVDEHEEEVSENGRTVRRQGIYLLPNLFTTGALFAGFYAVIAAMRGRRSSRCVPCIVSSWVTNPTTSAANRTSSRSSSRRI